MTEKTKICKCKICERYFQGMDEKDIAYENLGILNDLCWNCCIELEENMSKKKRLESDGKRNQVFRTIKETQEHIDVVGQLIARFIMLLDARAFTHDSSKMEPPELDIFVEYTPKLATTTYGSEEYKRYLKEMKPALDHHYKANLHHPEHFKNGVDSMSLIDLIEMFCDWIAASKRHKDGDPLKSIEINGNRFSLSGQLILILKNSVDLFDKLENRDV